MIKLIMFFHYAICRHFFRRTHYGKFRWESSNVNFGRAWAGYGCRKCFDFSCQERIQIHRWFLAVLSASSRRDLSHDISLVLTPSPIPGSPRFFLPSESARRVQHRKEKPQRTSHWVQCHGAWLVESKRRCLVLFKYDSLVFLTVPFSLWIFH